MRIAVDMNPPVVDAVRLEINNIVKDGALYDVGIFYKEGRDFIMVDAWKDGELIGRRSVKAVDLIPLLKE